MSGEKKESLAVEMKLSALDGKVSSLLKEFKAVKNCIQELKELKESVSFMSLKFEDWKNEMIAMWKENEMIKGENNDLREQVAELLREMRGVRKSTVGLSRVACNTSVQLSPVSFVDGEIVKNIVNKIIVAVGNPISNDDIDSCYRRRITTKGEPGALVVRLRSESSRDSFLNAIKQKGLKQSDLDFGDGDKKIFVREELPPLTRDLFFKALDFKKKEGYRFLWVKSGKIFLRKAEGDRCILVSDVSDLASL